MRNACRVSPHGTRHDSRTRVIPDASGTTRSTGRSESDASAPPGPPPQELHRVGSHRGPPRPGRDPVRASARQRVSNRVGPCRARHVPGRRQVPVLSVRLFSDERQFGTRSRGKQPFGRPGSRDGPSVDMIGIHIERIRTPQEIGLQISRGTIIFTLLENVENNLWIRRTQVAIIGHAIFQF